MWFVCADMGGETMYNLNLKMCIRDSMTSVKDCGTLLEKIYKGECVSKEVSEEMLNLLSNQENTYPLLSLVRT